jgi:hypothetical protein
MTTIIGRIWLLLLLLAPSLLSAQTRQPGEFVVVIHAGGGSIDDQNLREIGALLVKKGYVVRAPDRERNVKGGPGVDYFSSFAREAAEDVADTVSEGLLAMRLPPDAKQRLKPRLQLRPSNLPIFLEVWLP